MGHFSKQFVNNPVIIGLRHDCSYKNKMYKGTESRKRITRGKNSVQQTNSDNSVFFTSVPVLIQGNQTKDAERGRLTYQVD